MMLLQTNIKTTKNIRKNKLGCLPTSTFFYAFELGTKQKDQVLSSERELLACVTDSKGNLIFFLGKCSIPFLRGNWNFIFPSFMSITTPTVRTKGRPKIIGQEGSHSMSIIVKSTGSQLSLTMIGTLSIFPKGFFTEESTRRTPK